MKEDVSPEEKLLQVIRKVQPSLNRHGVLPGIECHRPEDVPEGVKSPSARGQRVFSWKEGFEFSLRQIRSGALRKIAVAVLALSAGLFLTSFGYSLAGPRMYRLPRVLPEKVREEDYAFPSHLRSLDQYVQLTRDHPVFHAPVSAETDGAIIASESNMVKDLTLIGIIGDSEPQAIIENKRSHDTYYVKKGKMIGEMLVEEIRQGKVLIQCGGVRYELNL